jgi:Zn/Cd-binding protein ZinT
MSINKYHKHILVLPEDDANRQIANGFILDSNLNDRAIQILPPAGGWTKVIDFFKNTHVSRMYQYHLFVKPTPLPI